MVTRTIEPIHVVLPNVEGGYYRFGDLPQLIAEALRPDTVEADVDPEGSYYVIRAFDQMAYEKDLPRFAALAPGEPGYLHVVENSPSKRTLERRMGAVLNAGLVHLDWLNEWGEARKPPHVFSTESAPEPQAMTPSPTPVETVGASGDVEADWRMQIQAEAYELWLRLRASGCNPTVYSICEDMAAWCIKQDIKGGKGQNPRAGTIRNSVLGGVHWKPPHHSVEQAKKHVAQIAQTAQTKVAQTAQ